MNIVLLSADTDLRQGLDRILGPAPFRVSHTASLDGLADTIGAHGCSAAIIDLDCVSVENREIKALKRKFPGTYFIIISNRHFHPKLQESIQQNIYACMTKPLDPDELFYLLRSIGDDEAGPGSPP